MNADSAAPPIVSIRGVDKRFGAMQALRNIDLDIEPGEMFALLGPSGCGKSTLLRIIAGFDAPSAGQVLLDGKDMTRLPPNKRPINMVFQSYAVFPHMSVSQNVAYGLQMERVRRSEIDSRVAQALEQVQLAGLGERRPEQLSGGQRQRVALARALVKRPRVLLLDEPLSALDAKLRDAMRLELVNLQAQTGVTFVIVTHDQSEAMALADRIAVLESGELRQLGSPESLYHSPNDAFVADFIGTLHAFPLTLIEPVDEQLRIEADGLGTVTLPGTLPDGMLPGIQTGRGNVAAVRPERIELATDAPLTGQRVVVAGEIGDIAFQGQHSIVEVRLPVGRSISAIVSGERSSELAALPNGTRIYAHWAVQDLQLLPERAPQ